MDSRDHDLTGPRQAETEGASLLPCPFCGGTNIIENGVESPKGDYFWHMCGGCCVQTEGEVGRENARAAWNRRQVAPPPTSTG